MTKTEKAVAEGIRTAFSAEHFSDAQKQAVVSGVVGALVALNVKMDVSGFARTAYSMPRVSLPAPARIA